MTVSASVKYMTASAMSLTVEGRPIGERLSITSLGVVTVQRRIDDAGRDRVHADAVFRVLHRQVLGDCFQTAFGDHRHRRREAPDRVPSQGRRDRDDAPAGLLRQHLLDRELGEVEESFEVGRDERPKVVGRVVGEPFRDEDARVVDERVDRPEPADSGLDNPGRCLRITNVSVDQCQYLSSDD